MKKSEYISTISIIRQLTTRGLILNVDNQQIQDMHDLTKMFANYRSAMSQITDYPKMTEEDMRLSEREHLVTAVSELRAHMQDINEECKRIGIKAVFYHFNSEMVRDHNKLSSFYWDNIDISELIDLSHGQWK